MVEIIAVIIGIILLAYLGFKDDGYEKERIKKGLLGIKPSTIYYIFLVALLFILFLLFYV